MAELTPANQNPWYVLSTLSGEQPEAGYDRDLAEKNVRLWNIWACQNLSEDARAKLRETGTKVPNAEAWQAHQAEIERRYAIEMAERNDKTFDAPDLPSADDASDMSKIAFSHFATFTQDATFCSARF